MATITGKTSNSLSGFYFSNNMGWQGGGLIPEPTVFIREGLPENFQGTKDICYEFQINDNIYKVCTESYSNFVAGQRYLSYRDLCLNLGYTDTGPLGTDLYITNFRLYDMTDDIDVKIENTSTLITNTISELGVTNGLIAYYPLSTNTRDYSGNDYNGTGYNVTLDAGKDGSGYKLSKNSNSYIQLGIPSSRLSSLSLCSLSFWMKLDAVNNWVAFTGHTTSYYTMATNGTGDFYGINSNTSLTTTYFDGIQRNAPIADTNWHHYVITGVDLSLWTSIKIGGYNEQYAINGVVNDVRIYNRILAPEEIATLYDIGSPSNTTKVKITSDAIYIKSQINET